MKTSIGIDISKNTFNGFLFNDKIEKSFKFENNQTGFNQFNLVLNNIKGNNDIYITMENTGTYHLKLAVFLKNNGYKVSVVNPLRIKNYAKMKMLRAKTDKLDAKTIAQFGMEQPLKIFKVKSLYTYKLRYYLHAIDDLKKVKTQFLGQLEALSTIPFNMEDIINEWKEQILNIDSIVKEFENKIKDIIDKQYSLEYMYLNSIPGIGVRLIPVILAYFGRFETFENSKEVCAFIGINPSTFDSGTSVHRKGHISKKGNKYIRKMIYMASLSASRFNKQCVNLFERLKKKNKPCKVIRVAVANKLLRQVFSIVKNKRMYDPEYKSAHPNRKTA